MHMPLDAAIQASVVGVGSMPNLAQTVTPKSELQQNSHLPCLLLLCQSQDWDKQERDTCLASSGPLRRGTTFEDAVNAPVGEAFEAP